MKRFIQFCTLFCILTVNLALGACTLESSSVAVQPAETIQPPQSDLEAILQVPTTLPDGDSVELEFTLINHSETGLYVLKWYTPLEGLAGEIFRIERDGQVIPYQGILATRITPPPEAYVLLEPGESVSAEVDLATAYDFSKSGEYTIEFLSPSISHVARTEAEMARTLNDLGPVQIPSKRVSVTIASASDLSVRWTPAEAAEMIRGYLRSQKPDLVANVEMAEEVTRSYVEALHNGEVGSAYRLLAEEVRSRQSQEEYASFLKADPNSGVIEKYEGLEICEYQFGDKGLVTAIGLLHYEGGDIYFVSNLVEGPEKAWGIYKFYTDSEVEPKLWAGCLFEGQ